jgi:hypothetical protein
MRGEDSFELHTITGTHCRHEVLLRTYTPYHGNADAAAEEHALVGEQRAHEELRARLERHLACPGGHRWQRVGSAVAAVGDDLTDGKSQLDGLALWVARTGTPGQVVLGTAESEQAFWLAVSEATFLVSEQPLYPAERRRVLFGADDSLDTNVARALERSRRAR